MNTPAPSTFDITAAPRAVLRESVRIISLLVGAERIGSSRDNAWAAVCADRERSFERAELARRLAATKEPASR